MLAAHNILGPARFDLWSVNTDADYHEDGCRLSDDGSEQTGPRMLGWPAGRPRAAGGETDR
jgi:hypothetical protein